jgi:tetratricopeptide (TPR) repeat protein
VQNIFKIKDKYIYLIICIIVFAIYVNSLQNDFVSDDRTGILLNPEVGEWSWVFRSFIGFGNNLSRMAIVHTFGMQAWAFRLFNIVSHAAVACSIYYLFKSLYDKKLGILVALLFAVHPILSESITWIAGAGYVSYALYFLISFIFFLESEEKYNWKYFVSLVFYLFAVLTSEKAVSLAAIFILYKFVYSQESKSSFLKSASYMLVTLPFVLMLAGIVGKRTELLATEYYQEAGFVNPLYQIPIAVTEYIQLFLWPQALTLYHSETSYSYTNYFIRLGAFLAIVGTLAFFTYKLRGGIKSTFMFWKNVTLNTDEKYKKILDYKYITFWFFFFIITMLPTMTPLKISWLVAERYAYLGVLGLVAIIAYFFYKLLNKESIKIALIGGFICILLALGIRTIYRNFDWFNQDTLWIATAKYSPSSPNNHNNLGDLYARQGDMQRAIQEFKYATELKPNYADAFHNLAFTYQSLYEQETDQAKQQEYFENAKKYYEEAIKYSPILWQSHQNLGILYFQAGDNENGYKEYQNAFAISPNNLALIASYININVQLKNFDEAEKTAQYMLSLDPSNPQIQGVVSQVEKVKAEAEAQPEQTTKADQKK